jgi:hypothetical protein
MGTPVVLTSAGAAYGFLAFTGVQFTIPNLGLQLTLEGSYSTADVHALGTKFGFAF